MAFTYLVLDIIFCGVVVLLLRRFLKRPTRAWWITFASIVGLTLIFDNLAIKLGFFSYAPEKILGMTIGVAPIEDFFYAVLACIIVPALWIFFGTQPSAEKESR